MTSILLVGRLMSILNDDHATDLQKEATNNENTDSHKNRRNTLAHCTSGPETADKRSNYFNEANHAKRSM